MSDLGQRVSVYKAELIRRPARSAPWKIVEDGEVSTEPSPVQSWPLAT